jgi:hypothetical protein
LDPVHRRFGGAEERRDSERTGIKNKALRDTGRGDNARKREEAKTNDEK